MQFSMYETSMLTHWKQNTISKIYFKSFSNPTISKQRKGFFWASPKRPNTNNKYLLIFKTSDTNENFLFWTFKEGNFDIINDFDLG